MKYGCKTINVFYYFRGRFNFTWSLIQIVVNTVLSGAVILGVELLFSNRTIIEASYGYPFMAISVPAFIAINKQIFDNITGLPIIINYLGTNKMLGPSLDVKAAEKIVLEIREALTKLPNEN